MHMPYHPATFFSLLLIIMIIVAPIIVAIFVARDARRRGLSPLAWGLAALLIPGMMGLVIYIIVASQHKPLEQCPSCRRPVEPYYQLCPYCSFRLKETCPQCNEPVAQEWQACAHCGHYLGNRNRA